MRVVFKQPTCSSILKQVIQLLTSRSRDFDAIGVWIRARCASVPPRVQPPPTWEDGWSPSNLCEQVESIVLILPYSYSYILYWLLFSCLFTVYSFYFFFSASLFFSSLFLCFFVFPTGLAGWLGWAPGRVACVQNQKVIVRGVYVSIKKKPHVVD